MTSPVSLTASDIRRLRLQNQWLAPRRDATVDEIVNHMGALQAQELWSGEWSIAARSPGLAVGDVVQASLNAQILRTWPIRGTIHFVSSADVRWMLRATSTAAFKGVERRRDFLGLSEEDAVAAVEVLREALADRGPVTRSECLEILADAGLMKDKAHAYHLLWFASQHGATCIGPQEGKEQTFVNLQSWVPDHNELTPDEALGELAYRYFDSHGPADATELRRWTGLSAGEVRQAIQTAGDRLTEVDTEFGPMLLSANVAETLDGSPVEAPEKSRSVLLLSGFDEYVLGYGDRSTMMTKEQLNLVVPGSNGIFRPTVVDDGVVIGTWKRALKKTRVDIEVSPFNKLRPAQLRGVERAAGEYGEFIGVEARVTVKD